ncbi:hypothetical protein PEC302107_06430 [Pectobacterium araliae]|nr:hypothetical protein PEC302107_06430 [Pectobacterium carotovorum subsp. carotovorum]
MKLDILICFLLFFDFSFVFLIYKMCRFITLRGIGVQTGDEAILSAAPQIDNVVCNNALTL